MLLTGLQSTETSCMYRRDAGQWSLAKKNNETSSVMEPHSNLCQLHSGNTTIVELFLAVYVHAMAIDLWVT